MKMKIGILLAAMGVAMAAPAQQKIDTVIVSLAKTSKVIFTMEDRNDLEILKHYNFQDLFSDILVRLEKADTTSAVASEEPTPADTTNTREENRNASTDESAGDENDEEWDDEVQRHKGKIGRTWQSFNFDLGMNNYLSNGKFPDNDNALYAVRPWGSWYFAAASTQRTRVGSNFFLEWSFGISWYNFKFQDDNVVLQKSENGTEFVSDTRFTSYRKSKLTASYFYTSFVPVWDLGGHSRKPRMWDGYRSAFRIGLGPYAGYRLASHSKLVYSDNGDSEKEKQRNSFYLNNFRYGARLQVGFRGTDLFFNYDLNELFADKKGPSLNAFSFGVIF